MDFKMYDKDDDYTCRDSTIAFKVLLFHVIPKHKLNLLLSQLKRRPDKSHSLVLIVMCLGIDIINQN